MISGALYRPHYNNAAMTTINTIEDLFRLLDENPQWVEARRARLLTRELIELPEKFSQFAADSPERVDRLEEKFDNFAAATNDRFDRVENAWTAWKAF